MPNNPGYIKESPDNLPGRKTEWWHAPARNRRNNHVLRDLERDKLEIAGEGGETVAATEGDVLQFVGGQWVPIAKTALLSLTMLTDVVLVSPASGDVLTFNGADWVNEPLDNLIDLDSLSDVTIGALADGDLLVYNGGSSQWGNRNWTPASFGVGAATTRGKFEITVSDVTTFFSENQEATTTTQGWRIDRTSAANTKPQGIVWRSENSPRWELVMDGASKNLGIFDHSGGAGAWVMRVSRETDATVDLGTPKFWFGRDAADPSAENVVFTFYAGDEVNETQGMRITHLGGVNDNALGLLNRNASIKTCRFNFNTLWIMGTDILGLNNSDYFFYDNVNNQPRIFIRANSNPFPQIGIGSVNPQAALSVLLDINATANTIQRVLHAQIANTPSNRGINIEVIREAGVAVWNYIWLAAGLGSGSTVGTRVATSTGARAWGWECSDNELNLASAPSGTNQTITRPIRVDFSGGVHRIGVFNVTPFARPAAYTNSSGLTGDRTLAAYTADAENVAYTGIDNAQAGAVYATVADLNALRVAVENLRALGEDHAKWSVSQVGDLQSYGWYQ